MGDRSNFSVGMTNLSVRRVGFAIQARAYSCCAVVSPLDTNTIASGTFRLLMFVAIPTSCISCDKPTSRQEEQVAKPHRVNPPSVVEQTRSNTRVSTPPFQESTDKSALSDRQEGPSHESDSAIKQEPPVPKGEPILVERKQKPEIKERGAPNVELLKSIIAPKIDLEGHWTGFTLAGFDYSKLVVQRNLKKQDEFSPQFSRWTDYGGSRSEKRKATFNGLALAFDRPVNRAGAGDYGGTDGRPYSGLYPVRVDGIDFLLPSINIPRLKSKEQFMIGQNPGCGCPFCKTDAGADSRIW